MTLYEKIFNEIDYKKTALVIDDIKISYQKLYLDTQVLINFFKKKYKTKKLKICMVLPNSYESILIFLLAAKLKYIIYPLNISARSTNIKSYCEKYKFDIFFVLKIKYKNEIKFFYDKNKIFTLSELKKFYSKSKSKFKSKFLVKKIKTRHKFYDYKYLVIFSSGSTGKPKPIVLGQLNKFKRSQLAGQTYNFDNKQTLILPYHLDHSVGQRLLFMSLIHNGTLIIMKNFNENLWFSLCKNYQVTFSILVSVHIKRIIKANIKLHELTKLKNLVSVSDVLEDPIRKKILNYKFNFHEIYGAAEISTVANIKHKKNSKTKSVGKILPFTNIKIVDENGKKVNDGKVGEIICKTPVVFNRYEKNRSLTKSSFIGSYFKTGDIGYLKKGYLFFLGRKKNMIKVSGLNVYPEDIETVLNQLPYIMESFVKGRYDKDTGQAIVAYLLADESKKDAIYEYCIKNLQIHQIPKYFYFVKKLPRTPLGKINRNLI